MMDSFITPSVQHSNTSLHLLALTRLYPIAGLLAGYLLVMLANPVRRALRDGFRCIARYERVWLTFALLGFAYFVFQFVTFSSVPSPSEIDFAEIIAIANWNWTPLADVWHEVPLPAIESVSGIFDNATTTYHSLLSLPSYFSLIGVDCIARSGMPYPSFTGGGAFRFISF